MNQEFKEALNRLDMLTDEINRIKRAIVAASNGVPFNEAFNKEVFLEDRQFEKSCRSYLATMMEHLLKLKYCTNNRNHNKWIGTIKRCRRDTMNEVGWKSKKNKDTNLCKFIINNLQDSYETAIEYYQDDAEEYEDLRPGLRLISGECPWTFEELMDETIEYLLNKLD